jgi:hypothetical protein
MYEYQDRLLSAIEAIATSLAVLAAPRILEEACKKTVNDEPAVVQSRKPAPVVVQSRKPEATKPEAAKPEAAKPEAAKPEAVKPEATPTFDYATLRSNVIRLAQKYGQAGKEQAIAILHAYGVKKADQLPEAKWPEANDKFVAAIEERERAAPVTDDEF